MKALSSPTLARAAARSRPAAQRDPKTGAVHLFGIDTVLAGFAASRPRAMCALRPPEFEGTESFAGLFAALAPLDRPDWHGRRAPAALLGSAEEELRTALASGAPFEIVNGWIRPWVSRLVHHAVGLMVPWSGDIYRAAYAVVAYLDGKYRDEADLASRMLAASVVIDGCLAELRQEDRGIFLSCFAQFATGHETPANLVATTILHGGPVGYLGVPVGPLVAEALRFAPPIRRLYREAARSVLIGGIGIAAGERLVLDLGRAGRDPVHFTEPETFRPDRGAPLHTNLFFGNPAAGCPGRNIGLGTAAALIGIFGRVAPGGLAVNGPRWIDTGDVCGLDALFVRPT